VNLVIGVKCGHDGTVIACDPGSLSIQVGDRVLLENEEGVFLGRVVYGPHIRKEAKKERLLPPILRAANAEDLAQLKECRSLEKSAAVFCQERVRARRMTMHLSAVERLHDGSKMIFYFTAEGRVDFRALVKDLAGRFHCRVEMRQIGVRNETKILGGVGCCGRELCCSAFMRDFTPVSVKMAKEQNLSLNPNKISGVCGRLMCCLAYEFPVYMQFKKNMPKVGKRVTTPEGEGKVVRQNVMAGRVTVALEGGEKEFPAGQVRPASASPDGKPNRSKPKNKQGRA